MVESISRRKFFAFLGGVAVAPLAVMEVAKHNIVAKAEFGWTWFLDKTKYPNLDEIVTKTLRDRAQMLADNVGKQNSLLLRLKENENNYIQIDYIDPKEQNKRMNDRFQSRLIEKETKRRQFAYENSKLITNNIVSKG